MRTMLQVIYCRNLIKLVLLIDYRLWQHCGISRWIFLPRYVHFATIRKSKYNKYCGKLLIYHVNYYARIM